MVGQATLIGLLPAFAQLTQFVLHLATAHCGGFFCVQQRFGLSHQFFAETIGQPALPARRVARSQQGVVHALIECGVQVFAVQLEQVAQGRGGLLVDFAFLVSDLLFNDLQNFSDGLGGLVAQVLPLDGVHFGRGRFGFSVFFGFFGRFCVGRSSRSRCCGGGGLGGFLGRHALATATANFIGPNRHGRQRGRGVRLGLLSLDERRRKTLPNGLQLTQRGIQLGRKLQVHAGPHGIAAQMLRLALPLRHIVAETGHVGLCLSHWFG